MHTNADGNVSHRIQNYGVFTVSPVCGLPDPLNVPTADEASTLVIVSCPMAFSIERSGLPVAGSFTTRTTRETASLSPTFTPDELPTLMMMLSGADASATSPETGAAIGAAAVGSFALSAFRFAASSATACDVASPIIVCAKLLLFIPASPPP